MSKKKRHSTTGAASQQRDRSRASNLKWLWVGIGILVLAAAGYLFFRPSSGLPTEITPAQAYEKYRNGAFFLDVRSQAEWDQVHIAGSTLIPLDELQGRLGSLPKDQDIVVVCRSGVRSKEGMSILRQAGFARSTCMTGGIQAWMAAGYPVEP